MNIHTALKNSRELTLPYYELNTSDLSKTYASGKWNIKQILVHLADAESILHERIKRVIAEPKQVIWAFDQDLWCENINYKTFPLELGKSIYKANRDSVIYLAEHFYDTLGNKEFIHSESGLKTLKDEFDKVALHNQSHLKQIEQALSNNF